MGRHKGYNREEVLDRAMKLFWRKGYEGAHLQELVEITGLNRFSLYKEFGGKEGLFLEALDRYLSQVMNLMGLLFREPQGLENIQDYFKAAPDYPFYHGCFAVNTLVQNPVVPEEARRKVFDFINAGEKVFLSNLKAARKKGELPPGMEPRSLARHLITFDIGLVVSLQLGVDKRGIKQALKPLEVLLGVPL
jgi:AcrR family transcriptional regulator